MPLCRRASGLRISLAGAALCLLLASDAFAQTVNDPGLQVELVASGLSLPTSMAFVGESDILVLQKNNGHVRRILDGALHAGAVLDVAVDSANERGLLGIALDPDFPVNRNVFLYYTESSTGADTNGTPAPLGNRVYRYIWDGSALVNPLLILDLPVLSGPNHNGGVLTFGADGALYGVIGDLNRRGKLQNASAGPDPDDTGVIFRVDTLGKAIGNNPFFSALRPTDPMNKYFAYGVRNSFGLAFDPITGRLWDTENAETGYDEVNRVSPGFNSGWIPLMGPDARDPQSQADLWVAPGSAYSDPEFSWSSQIAPTALTFPTSPVSGCALLNNLVVGDNNCGLLYRFTPNAARDGLAFTSSALQDLVADNGGAICSAEMAEIIFGTGFGVITDLESGPDGWLYVVSISNGRVYRIGPRPGAFPDIDGDVAGDACDCAPSDSSAYAAPVEVPRVRVTGTAPTVVSWDPQWANTGGGTAYSVVSGDTGALRSDGGFASACTLRRGRPATTMSETRPDPPAGTAQYYLARAENVCANGTFGNGSGTPDPRDQLDAALPPDCLCSSLTGGAMIRFNFVSGVGVLMDSLTVWITNGPFIDRAKFLLATHGQQIPVFNGLIDGGLCDPQWTWHVDPQDVSFADFTIELCDGLPSHIEADKEYWLNSVGSYCPWSAVVVAVDERRY